MQINLDDGCIGFESDKDDHGHISQWWIPTTQECDRWCASRGLERTAMRNYLLIMRGGVIEHWSVAEFNLWVAQQGEKIGANFESRLDQFRRYTGQDIIDWEMEDDQP